MPQTRHDEPTTLEDRYELVERLGEGGMGIVFLARDLVLDIPVAVKMLRGEYCRSAEVVRMFEQVFLVNQPDSRSLLKVLDFGVAEKLARPGGSGSVGLIGTTAYLAPEVFFGPGPPDARTDLYALGVVAYECLTGACPYPPECYDDLFDHMSRSNRLSVRETRPELPEEIDEWMDRALHPDPFWRFASARELARELDRVLHASAAARARRAATAQARAKVPALRLRRAA